VASVQTPTLILHGEVDERCPVGQGEEWLGALRDQRVPVEMVRYPEASHLFILNGRPSHRIDYGRRLAEWVGTYAGGGRRPGRRPRRTELPRRLSDLITRHHVPGASLAVLAGGEVSEAAAGLLNTRTGQAATPDSLWQIGSITKVYTATLIMQLAEAGRLDLDAPVVEVLPDLRLADPDATKRVTPRHLLSHTSGIPGDLFLDTGRGDDCVARYVAACEDLSLSHPLGATMSYCNAGYVIAGRIVEQLTDQSWDRALADRVLAPLGLTHTMTLPEEVIRYGAAIGHAGEPAVPVDTWILPRSTGPAGLISATASDVVAFARMHLDGGAGVLSGASVRAMQEPQVVMPDPFTLGTHWGLGWILFEWNKRVYGHDGSTIGQGAFLRVVPDEGLAIALLTNGGNAADLYRDLYGGLLSELAGVLIPERPGPPATPPDVDLDEHVGVYERVGNRIEVTRREDHLVAKVTITGELAAMVPTPTTEYELTPVSQDLFVTRPPGTRTWAPMTFYRLEDGSAYVHFGVRATPKVS
jgi:CubicO group peptidase (beta-lactamase class C family)